MNPLKCFWILVVAVTLSSGLSADTRQSEIVSTKEIKWGYLNPLRGKLSPGAADLWGDRTVDGATGMLVRFNKRFASPPHIHNITYRGVVIEGELHNDDPAAAKLWMPPISFWTQPAGEEHVTAANGDTNLIYLEIDSGPYLVKPSKEQFDNGERPINIHRNNLVWQSADQLEHVQAQGVETAELWRDADSALGGTMLRLAPGFSGSLDASSDGFRMIVVSGQLSYQSAETSEIELAAASYVGSKGRFTHQFTNRSDSETVLYVRSDSSWRIRE